MTDAAAPFLVECSPPLLTARFSKPQQTLGWSLLHPGFATVETIVWLEVRNADLTAAVDPVAFLKTKLQQRGLRGALAFMTSRDIRRWHCRTRRVEGVTAACLTTVGLSNGERIGSRRGTNKPAGTINTLIHVNRRLSEGAMIESISIAAQARTLAIVEALRSEGAAQTTGTGTDCIVVACPLEGESTPWAGLHTAVGEAMGGAVYDATREGAETWTSDASSRK